MSPDPLHEVFSFASELRAVADEATGARTIEGYAVVWDALSSIPMRDPQGRPFFERIARGAFAESLLDPELACFLDHDTGKVLGRIGAGTLDVIEDDHGLLFRCRLGRSSHANDAVDMIERGDMWGCSFGFYNARGTDVWSNEDGRLIRTIVRGKLFDVSPVGRPTYRETRAALRSLSDWEAQAAAPGPDPGVLALARARLRIAEARHR